MSNQNLTGRIIGCAMKVHTKLGPGYKEEVYQRALAIEFRRENIVFEEYKPVIVYYDNEIIGEFEADMFVTDPEANLILELKAVLNILTVHEIQLVNYLVATRTDVGLLLNFGGDSLDFRKKFRQAKSKTRS
jgi:GxxExxY protein